MSYKVPIESDFVPDPEESLVVPVNERMRVAGRTFGASLFKWLCTGMAVFFLLIGVFVFRFSFAEHDFYALQAKRNEYLSFPIMPARGTIYDRNFTVLADNSAVYDVIVFKKASESDLTAIAEIIHRESSEFIGRIKKSEEKAVIISDLSEEQAHELKDSGIEDLYVVEEMRRTYPKGKLFSHLLGYVSEVLPEDVESGSYEQADKKGITGLEAHYEEYLQGERGSVLIPRRNDSEPRFVPFQKGNDMVLALDAELQEVAHQSLMNGLDLIGANKGVVVIQDTHTGAVRSLVSIPSYDNNAFVEGIDAEEYRALAYDPLKPLLNHAIGGRFSPGSTIKPLFALAALEEDIIDPLTRIKTHGYLTVVNPYDPSVVYTFNDWKNHGTVNMFQAIANSVDVYFYIIGGGYKDITGLGIDRMAKYLKQFRADETLGIDIPGEIAGLVPTQEWKLETKGESWYIGDSYNVSIGQGDLLVTPLWINSYVSAIANGGTIYKPYTVMRIIDGNGKTVYEFDKGILDTLIFDPKNLDIVKKGMRTAVTEGTIKRYLNELPVPVAAKTGTAEVIKDKKVNSFVTLFAPYEDPRISMTVLVEDAQEGLSIAPYIARDILEWYFDPVRNE